MRRALRTGVAVAVAIGAAVAPLAACGTGGSSNGPDSGNPCEGLGCASGPGQLVIQVIDAAGRPIASPTFTENGRPLSAYCETDGGQILLDASVCGAWRIDVLSIGQHTITVGAPGYPMSQTIMVSVSGPMGCCGRGPDVDETVTLYQPHGEAGGEAGDAGPVDAGPGDAASGD